MDYETSVHAVTYKDYSFIWTGRNLTGISDGDTDITYAYNKVGIRVKKVIPKGVTTDYYLEENRIIREQTRSYIIWYLYDENGAVIGYQKNGESYYYKKNMLGDIIGIWNAAGIQK